jgi:hypothetical protein
MNKVMAGMFNPALPETPVNSIRYTSVLWGRLTDRKKTSVSMKMNTVFNLLNAAYQPMALLDFRKKK